MSGVAIEFDWEGMSGAQERVVKFEGWDLAQLAADVGTLVESQTKRRIDSEKTAPDGAAWPDWSSDYAKTRPAGKSLLQDQNHLLTSVQSYATADQAIVGSNLAYAAVHQRGATDGDTPERAYLGLSAANAADVEALVIRRAEELLA